LRVSIGSPLHQLELAAADPSPPPSSSSSGDLEESIAHGAFSLHIERRRALGANGEGE